MLGGMIFMNALCMTLIAGIVDHNYVACGFLSILSGLGLAFLFEKDRP